ncbi:GNAT family N-acetyltransferase, partial [Mycobacterium sp.]|uniref:GNAT family N-acetyltransferase n=1 Tax=Mycobacterium sp. TaxID=1785 RepID=UPI00128A13B3
RRSRPDDVVGCVAIVRDLPDYFTKDVPARVTVDLADHYGWVATDTRGVVGFTVIDRRSERTAEILWMAVRNISRGAGIGTALLDHVLGELGDEGLQLVEVKTLDAAADYAPYVATRAFWERRGFIQIDTIDPMPGWQSGDPAAVCVAALAPTR